MLTDIFRVMVNNPFKVSFYGKKIQLTFCHTAFSIFHKNCVKILLK